MANTKAFLTNDQARAWINRSGVLNCDSKYEYFSCVSIDGLSRDFGDQTRVECPDPDQYGKFILAGTYGGEISQLTTAMTGRYSGTELSMLYNIANNGCPFDLQIFTGRCQRPTDRTDFDKVLVLEGVNITSWSTDPLIALQSGDRAVVNETVDITVQDFFEIINLVYVAAGEDVTDLVLDNIISVEYYDQRNCGDCGSSDGCQKVFAVSKLGFAYYSTDGGATWAESEIKDGVVVPTGDFIDAMVFGNLYIAITPTEFWFMDVDELLAGGVAWTMVLNGFAGVPAAMASYGSFGLVVEAGGVISQFTNQETDTIVVYDGASIAFADLASVATLGSGISVAGGEAGVIVYSTNGTIWSVAAAAPAAAVITSILIRSETSWLVGTDDSELYCTDDSGTTWKRVAYPGWASPTGAINDLKSSNSHVVWMAQNNRLLRSIDGGHTWILEPNTRSNAIAATSLNAVAACSYNPNAVVAGGQDANIVAGSRTSILVVGSI